MLDRTYCRVRMYDDDDDDDVQCALIHCNEGFRVQDSAVVDPLRA